MHKGFTDDEPATSSDELTQGLLEKATGDPEGMESTVADKTLSDFNKSDDAQGSDETQDSPHPGPNQNYESVKRRYDFIVSDFVRSMSSLASAGLCGIMPLLILVSSEVH